MYVFVTLLLGINLKKTTRYHSDSCTKKKKKKNTESRDLGWGTGLTKFQAANIGLLDMGDGSRDGRHVGNWDVF